MKTFPKLSGLFRIAGAISRRWKSLRITTKFGVAFSSMLMIVILVSVIGYAALTNIWQANNNILLSSNIQRLAMDMSRNWEMVRRLRNDFFFQSHFIGADQAYKLYALPAGGKIDEVIRDGAALKRFISSPEVSDIVRKSDADLQLYLATVSQYATTFEQATELELQLASEGTGLQWQLIQKAVALSTTLQSVTQPDDLLVRYYEMRSFEMDYLPTQASLSDADVSDAADRLRQAIESYAMDAYLRESALASLAEYEQIAIEVIKTNAQIQENLDGLNFEDQSIEPILIKLRAAVNDEVSRAQLQINQTRQASTVMLVAATLIGLMLAISIAMIFHYSVTRNVTKLTKVASQLQNGNLAARAQIGTGDELGQLASTFNDMAAELGQTIGRLEVVNEAGLDFARELDVESVIARALDAAITLSGADAGFIGIAEGDELFLARAIGPYSPEFIGSRLSLASGIVARAVHHRQTEIVMDVAGDPDDINLIPASRAKVAIPLVSAQQLIGVLCLEARQPECFRPNTIKFLELSAVGAAVAIHNARLYSDAQRKAIEDPLTGLYNRRGLFELSRREINRAIRFKTPISVLFLDIDHFKQFNDLYSYEVGDLILHTLARCLINNARDTDLVCRYGGEEFVILLPESGQDGALRAAERLRMAVESEHLQTDQGDLAVTVSLGVAVLTPTMNSPSLAAGQEEQVLNGLIDQAGQMLHKAKARGRNRVAAADG